MANLRFQCLLGSAEGESFELDGPVTLGRDTTCDVPLRDPCCSRRHALIERLEDRYRIRDLGSRNGVSVNGSKVEEATLCYGDRFMVGRTLFVFLSEVLARGPDSSDEAPVLHDVETIDVHQVERRLTVDLNDAADSLLGEGHLVDGDELEVHPLDSEQLRKELVFLCQLSKELNGTLEIDVIVETVTRSVLRKFEEADRVSFFFFEASQPPALQEVESLCRDGKDSRPVSLTILKRIEQERVGILCGNVLDFARSKSVFKRDLRSFMCVPLVVRTRLLGAIYLENLSRAHAFSRADFELLTLVANHSAAALSSALTFEHSQTSYLETVRSLGNALDAKDSYTRGHSERVAHYAVGIGKELGFDTERLRNLRIAAELHDIGKIAIKDALIGKDGRLTPAEFEQIKKHPELGVGILRPIRFLWPILPFILHHHERYNGRGYPDGLKGEEIPLEARIINLADALDAMTTQRSYNQPISIEEALERCEREAGVSFDPVCVPALLRFLREKANPTSTVPIDTGRRGRREDMEAVAVE
jgi:HD-GYP domain-containing protein (c-di-GMP phosphodiesterase class II)